MTKFYVKCTDFALATWETRSTPAALHACGSRFVLRWDVATRNGRRRTVSAQESELIWLCSYLVSALQKKESYKRLLYGPAKQDFLVQDPRVTYTWLISKPNDITGWYNVPSTASAAPHRPLLYSCWLVILPESAQSQQIQLTRPVVFFHWGWSLLLNC